MTNMQQPSTQRLAGGRDTFNMSILRVFGLAFFPQNAPDSNMNTREFGKGEGGSGFAEIPAHVKQAKEHGSGFSGTRSI